MDNLEIVTLNPDEWQEYKNIRLKALKLEPQAFSSTYEDNANKPDEEWRQRLEDSTQWLVFARLNGKVIGMIGAFVEKEIENARIGAVYVDKEARGRGISKLLMKDLLSRIKKNKLVKKITVEVNPEQEAAFKLYNNSGFQLVRKYRMVLGDGKVHDVFVFEMLLGDS